MCLGIGSGVKWNHNSILGFTDDETVMLDFDDTPFKQVKYWAQVAMKHYGLGGFLILKSSENHYHVVFNRRVDWAENMSIVAWVSLQSNNQRARARNNQLEGLGPLKGRLLHWMILIELEGGLNFMFHRII